MNRDWMHTIYHMSMTALEVGLCRGPRSNSTNLHFQHYQLPVQETLRPDTWTEQRKLSPAKVLQLDQSLIIIQ
jgi:hypothetical protein